MAKEIKVPVPDQTTEEVRIVKWVKGEGEAVAKGEVILEVETDKSVMEVESIEEGVLLKQMVQVDDMVAVSAVVGYVGQSGESIGDPSPQSTVASPQEEGESSQFTVHSSQEEGKESGQGSVVSGQEIEEVIVEISEGVKELKIPVPDQTTEEVRVVGWKKTEGEAVAKGEVVLEVETDKSVMEVESIADGVLLKQAYKEDDMVPVGEVVGYVGPAGTVLEGRRQKAKGKSEEKAAETSMPTLREGMPPERVKASPMAKKLAGKLGVDLSLVTGSGAQGRIVREDVEKQVKSQKSKVKSEEIRVDIVGGRIFASPNAKRLAKELGVDLSRVRGSGPNGRIVGADVERFAKTDMPKLRVGMPPGGKVEVAEGQPAAGSSVAITKMRRAIGKNLQMSFRDTPHFFVTMSADMSQAMAVRTELNAGRPKEKRISVNDLVMRAVALALKQYPAVNSRMDEKEIYYLKDINVGVATAVEAGLVVPVLTNADQRGWDDLALETKRLAQAARGGKILNAGKGTFTLSNLGMFGVEEFTAIINPPESAILAVGAVKNEVVDIGGGIGVRPMMKMTLCSDHRVVDGALAAQFLRAVKIYLEEEINSEG
jgi:pyruvate dehydrogenase E2 component (dihydrolipoyllysine-residue acetyltransferase)